VKMKDELQMVVKAKILSFLGADKSNRLVGMTGKVLVKGEMCCAGRLTLS
jgi:hypothetical protein